MRLTLLAVGRMRQGPERDLFGRYADRAQVLSRGVGLTGLEFKEFDESPARSAPERMREEARTLGTGLPSGTLVAVLDERGKSMSSQAFADAIVAARDRGRAAFALMIGGPDGLDPALRSGAALSIAYGTATFPHQLVRVLAAEQIYRALTIIAGHPYHRA